MIDISYSKQTSTFRALSISSLVISIGSALVILYFRNLMKKINPIIDRYEIENLYPNVYVKPDKEDEFSEERKYLRNSVENYLKSLRMKTKQELKKIKKLHKELRERSISFHTHQKKTLLREMKQEYMFSYATILEMQKHRIFHFLKTLLTSHESVNINQASEDLDVSITLLKKLFSSIKPMKEIFSLSDQSLKPRGDIKNGKSMGLLREGLNDFFNQKYEEFSQTF